MSEKTSPTVLHLRFKLRVPPDDLVGRCRQAAEKIASAEGLIWKIWLVQQEQREMGGTYLFADRQAAVDYLNHPIIQAVCSNPAVMSVDSQVWEVSESLSALTRGPLQDIRMEEPAVVMAGGR
jgi:hypothetical protein